MTQGTLNLAWTPTIVLDSRERHPWRFAHQQAQTVRRALAAGDDGVELAGALVASVHRKSLARPRLDADHRPAGVVAEGLAESQVRYPLGPHRVV